MAERQREREIVDPPTDTKTLRACLYCSLVRTLDQFEREGCLNCDSFLQLKRNKNRVSQCTSASFEGLISMLDPDTSWVGKWQKINGKSMAKGVYAVSVNGRLPRDILNDMPSDVASRYQPRTQS
ncbi:hypothetical protein PROFUN_06547 [Planoprotostelium fungivorum]|uniref:Spt4/RpoE2 zinc finger domain-containing protein n=1 Tax=Planoprotostelium fungivorum TaxID=1890364 RepID=A0A2P6MRT4_9EUKA|nr:hypothetical protein PROFUN_06547 [Planoprotostelium fungivorum]